MKDILYESKHEALLRTCLRWTSSESGLKLRRFAFSRFPSTFNGCDVYVTRSAGDGGYHRPATRSDKVLVRVGIFVYGNVNVVQFSRTVQGNSMLVERGFFPFEIKSYRDCS
ncbi:hypothetical protein QE152_g31904 [Popillia japonica]|uniref:Uncharacterized protein n=1 Tax=Popillia japonica TaxID=7064 RepID=A0AAW1J151_POPJA